MEKLVSVAAAVALTVIAFAFLGNEPKASAAVVEPPVDVAALNASVDARLHTLLGQMVKKAEKRAAVAKVRPVKVASR